MPLLQGVWVSSPRLLSVSIQSLYHRNIGHCQLPCGLVSVVFHRDTLRAFLAAIIGPGCVCTDCFSGGPGLLEAPGIPGQAGPGVLSTVQCKRLWQEKPLDWLLEDFIRGEWDADVPILPPPPRRPPLHRTPAASAY